MSADEEVAYATIAAVSQAKMGRYSPLLEDAESSSAIGADAKTLAKMLVKEEKKVLSDLRQQLMSVVRVVCSPLRFHVCVYVLRYGGRPVRRVRVRGDETGAGEQREHTYTYAHVWS